MADIKISALPAYTNQIISVEKIPLVTSGNVDTRYVETKQLFSNVGISPANITDPNAKMTFIAGSSGVNSNYTGTDIDGGRAFLASSSVSIGGGKRSGFIGSNSSNDTAVAGNWQIGTSSTSIQNGYYNSIISSEAPVIRGGAWNSIMASYGGSEIQGGESNFIAASQGFVLGSNSNKCAGVGVESGGWNGPRYSFAGGGYNLTTNNDNGNDHFAGAYNGLTFDGSAKGGFLYKVAGIAVQDGRIVNDISALIASSGRTTLYDQTLHTDNIHTFKTETFDVIPAGNVGGSINVDCSLGTIFTFTLTADTTPNFINVRTGQRFIFIVYNNGAWAVPTATVNGSAGTVFAKNGNISPSNNGYTKYTATFDGTRMFLDEELGFAAV